MANLPKNDTRERIFDTAEKLFMSRGYSSVKLRDIADEVGMRHASLYYYVPKGKEQLFVEVVRRAFNRHHAEMNRVILDAGDNIKDQIYAVSDWLVAQTPIDLARLFRVDIPSLESAVASELNVLVFDALNDPLHNALIQAIDKGTVALSKQRLSIASMSLITLLQTVHHVPIDETQQTREEFAHKLCDLILEGLLPR